METLGVFPDVESAGRAVAGLIQAGFVERQITSLTSVAYPDGALVRVDKRSWFRWVSLAGAAAGAFAGFGLAAGTAWLYPVQTGDKPIVALFPASIVTFEVTMLCAIIGALVGMFLEMKLPAWRPRLYDPAIAEGYIGISLTFHGQGEVVVCGPGREGQEQCIGSIAALPLQEQRDRAEEIMRQAGALRTILE
jgi:hypothetical protein